MRASDSRRSWRYPQQQNDLWLELAISSETAFYTEVEILARSLEEHINSNIAKNNLYYTSQEAALNKLPEHERDSVIGDVAAEDWYLRNQLRILRLSLFTAAFAFFEHTAFRLAKQIDPGFRDREGNALDALRVLRPSLEDKYRDFDSLHQRVTDLRALREEFAHAAGEWRQGTAEKLRVLIKSGELERESPDFPLSSVITPTHNLIPRSLTDLRNASIACHQVARL